LLREKEREAWQNLLRVLSHEINNSLTPIATISGSLLKKETSKTAQKENSLSKGLAIVKERAESLKQFVSGYSRLYHLPLPNKELCQLDDLFKRIFPLFPDCMLINKTDKQLTSFKPIYIDSGQVEQVFVNLMKNAEESMSHLTQKVIEFDIHEESNWLHIYIQDSGIGLANTDNLFVPFYTTKENGSGIGLMLSQQILLNHNGAISLENREDTIGARATISIPIAKQ
jgi:nitrogen fixation/metabolism regulation signal transduction histidine kinase